MDKFIKVVLDNHEFYVNNYNKGRLYQIKNVADLFKISDVVVDTSASPLSAFKKSRFEVKTLLSGLLQRVEWVYRAEETISGWEFTVHDFKTEAKHIYIRKAQGF